MASDAWIVLIVYGVLFALALGWELMRERGKE